MADNKNKKTNNTQQEIEAALAAATGGMPEKCTNPCIQNLDQGAVDEALMQDNPNEADKPGKRGGKRGFKKNADKSWYAKENIEGEPVDEDAAPPEEESAPIAVSQQQFVEDCFNLRIDAKQCFYQSSKNSDKSVEEYIRSINKRIYDETQKGGYSTPISFRVTPNDWVNINHIIDWYKSRGFLILNYESSQPPYGNDVGTISYNFTISWATI